MIGESLTRIETKYWRLAMYGALAVAFAFISVEAVNTEWSGIDELHTVLEASAAIIALVVGAMAFTRHYSHPEAKYLWMAVGFIGAGLLDGFHTALTTWLSAVYFPTLLDTAAKGSEFAPRFFLALMLCFSGWSNQAAQDVNERFIYFMAAIVFVVCVYVFAISGLPVPQQAESLIRQPVELIPAALCGIAFLGFLKNGNWRDKARKFDHFAMVSLIAAAFSHGALMAFSQHPLDASFDLAHYAKIFAYLCILFGLLNSMRYAFQQAFHGDRRFREAVETLGEGFALYDSEDRLVVFNEAYAKLHPATRDIIKVGMKFEDFVRATVQSRTVDESIGNEEEYIRQRVQQHRNPSGPIVREHNDGTSYIINESKTEEGWIAVVETDVSELKSIEAELAEKSGFLEATFNAMDDGLSVWSPDHILLAFNEKFATLMGPPDETPTVGMSIRDLFILNAKAGLYGEGDPEELGTRRHEGAMRAEANQAQYITFDPHGTYEVLRNFMPDGRRVTIHRNVTDRVAAEQRLAQVVENLSELFVLWDPQDRLVMVNKRFRDLSAPIADICKPGLPFEDFVRTGVERGLFPMSKADPEAFIADRIAEHRNPGNPREVARQGRQWILLHEQRLPDGGTVSVGTDITEIKRVEAQVKDREQRLTAIVDNVVDGIITFDQDGIISSANPAAGAIFGCSVEDFMRQQLEDFISKDDNAVDPNLGTANLLSGEITGIQECNGRRRNGSTFPMELAVARVEAGIDSFFVCIVRDISARREMDRMKNEFVSTVSHELRTPLTSIRASLGLIVAGAVGELPDQAEELVVIAERNSHRLIGLVNDILDMEKIESGRMDFHFAERNIGEVVSQAIVDNQGYADEYNVEFKLTNKAQEVTAVVDSERLTQVMANLLSNAAKFSPEASVVEVLLEQRDNLVRVSVADCGSGIPEAFRSQVFEKFTQADSSDTRKVGGTGLGLSISRSIVERHGGRIDFKSIPDVGATFYFDLPVKSSAPSKMVNQVTAKETSQGERPLILICEDDVDVARLISLLLEESGYRSEIAYSAEEAEKLALSGRFDAMTVDLMLPDRDGLSLVQSLREHEDLNHLPIVIVSAAADRTPESVRASCMEIVDWLNKPIDAEHLVSAIHTALSQQTKRAPKILHVEDDVDLSLILGSMLPDDVELTCAVNVAEARSALAREEFDLVILDVYLPDGSGLDLLQLLRSNGHANTPSLIFSGDDVDQSVATQVAGVLVKSRTSNAELLDVIGSLMERNSPKTAITENRIS